MVNRRSLRSKKRGQRKDGRERFILFPEWVLLHSDWRTAPPGALPLLLDIHKRWTGPTTEFNNNGRIGYGVRAATAIRMGKDTASELLWWLMDRDWIRPGEAPWRLFSADGRRRQREWELTYLPTVGRPSVRRESRGEARPEKAGRRLKVEH